MMFSGDVFAVMLCGIQKRAVLCFAAGSIYGHGPCVAFSNKLSFSLVDVFIVHRIRIVTALCAVSF